MLIDSLTRDSDALLELGYMEYVVDSCQMQRESQSVCHGSAFLNNLIGADVTRS